MDTHRNTVDDAMRKLSAESREKVRRFILTTARGDEGEVEKFVENLEAACERVFGRYEQSSFGTLDDLKQEVFLKFWSRHTLEDYSGGPQLEAIFEKIATNVLIDAQRHSRSTQRVKLRQSWAGALSDYGEAYTSLELQKKALGWRTD